MLRTVLCLALCFVALAVLPGECFAVTPWVRQFGTPKRDWCTDVAAPLGGVFAACVTFDDDAFDPQVPSTQYGSLRLRSFTHGGLDRFETPSISPVYVWNKPSVAHDQSLNVYLTYVGYQEIRLRKYSMTGQLRWDRRVGTNCTSCRRYGPRADALGKDVYVVNGRSNIGPDGGVEARTIEVHRYDETGAVAWTIEFPQYGHWMWPDDVVVTASGIYVAGSAGVTLESGGGSNVSVLHKITPQGTVEWESVVGDGALGGFGANVAGIYLAGNFSGQSVFVKWGHDGAEIWRRNDVHVSVTAVEVTEDAVFLGGFAPAQANSGGAPRTTVIVRTDLDGNQVWSHQIRSFGENYLDAISAYEGAGAGPADRVGAYVAGFVDGEFAGEVRRGRTDCYVGKVVTPVFDWCLPPGDASYGSGWFDRFYDWIRCTLVPFMSVPFAAAMAWMALRLGRRRRSARL